MENITIKEPHQEHQLKKKRRLMESCASMSEDRETKPFQSIKKESQNAFKKPSERK